MPKKEEKLKCPDCSGTGVDPLKSNPFVKKDCQTCMGTGSAHKPEFCYVCDICDISIIRPIENTEKTEMGCHECSIIICPDCQIQIDGEMKCPKCKGELYPSIF